MKLSEARAGAVFTRRMPANRLFIKTNPGILNGWCSTMDCLTCISVYLDQEEEVGVIGHISHYLPKLSAEPSP